MNLPQCMLKESKRLGQIHKRVLADVTPATHERGGQLQENGSTVSLSVLFDILPFEEKPRYCRLYLC